MMNIEVHVQQLRRLASRVEEFLLEQVQRLESALAELDQTAAPQGGAGPLLAEIQEEQRRLEEERQRDRERLGAETARLAEAWQRVEAEQRRLLAQRETFRAAASPAHVNRDCDESDCVADRGPAVRPAYRGADTARGPAADDEPLSPAVAVLQFQQLRREIQKHVRRAR